MYMCVECWGYIWGMCGHVGRRTDGRTRPTGRGGHLRGAGEGAAAVRVRCGNGVGKCPSQFGGPVGAAARGCVRVAIYEGGTPHNPPQQGASVGATASAIFNQRSRPQPSHGHASRPVSHRTYHLDLETRQFWHRVRCRPGPRPFFFFTTTAAAAAAASCPGRAAAAAEGAAAATAAAAAVWAAAAAPAAPIGACPGCCRARSPPPPCAAAAAAVSAPVGMWVDSIELTPPLSGMPPPSCVAFEGAIRQHRVLSPGASDPLPVSACVCGEAGDVSCMHAHHRPNRTLPSSAGGRMSRWVDCFHAGGGFSCGGGGRPRRHRRIHSPSASGRDGRSAAISPPAPWGKTLPCMHSVGYERPNGSRSSLRRLVRASKVAPAPFGGRRSTRGHARPCRRLPTAAC